ncbi:ATP-binding protein [Sphaerisporangium sp. B11E5]|uniref:ATP-binding protein n=1 Tax=Sphaerisporangium sp. B11E5 TaxID=3153563 RepID=UPI00325CAB72
MTRIGERTETAAFPATGPSISEARRWLGELLEGHPRLDDAVLLLSEAMTNSLVHTDSAAIGVTITTELNGDVRIEVSDEGAQTLPALHPHSDDEPSPSGRGIRLIRALSSRWGFAEQRPQSVLWFVLGPHSEEEISRTPRVMSPPALRCTSSKS